MNNKALRSDLLLLLTAAIWGFAFVAQRVGMEHLGPYAFNGIRFGLGCMVLAPIIVSRRSKKTITVRTGGLAAKAPGALLAGLVLFLGSSFQQVGLVHTTAGNAGFITGLYMVIVPVFGAFTGHRTSFNTWAGAFIASAGLYLLCIKQGSTMAFGDMLELIGAFFWAGHVLIIARLSPVHDPFKLAFTQYAVCSCMSLAVSLFIEKTTFDGVIQTTIPLLYGGILSVGVAYTLQVIAQRTAPPAHASIILSLEAVFASIGGWIMLKELLNARELMGCMLMLAGMLTSQMRRND